MGNHHHLPEEIITYIISRLPFDTVLECKRVCKTWRTLISHPSFAQIHLRHSLQQLDDYDNNDGLPAAAAKVSFICRIGFFKCKKKSQLYYGEYKENDDHSYEKLTKINHPPLFFSTLSLHSSCNGLICLKHININKDDVYICNPITREYIILPSLVTETPLNKRGYGPDGFGYSPKTNEYKFVRIHYKDYYSVGQVHVYTLGSGCGWRNLGEISYRFRNFPGVLANGALHWVEKKEKKIVSFDLADEEFRLLPSPPCSDAHYYYLQVLGGGVCAVYKYVNDGRLIIWSFKKKKVEEKGSHYNMAKEQKYHSLMTWSLEHIIQWEGMPRFLLDNYAPFFLKKSGEVLMIDVNRCLYRYNLKTASAETLVDYAPGSTIYATILHMNTFVSLKALGEDAKIIGSDESVIELQNG